MAKKQEKYKVSFTRGELRDVDKALYCFLQTMYELKLITEKSFYHCTTTETNLLFSDEEV